MEQNFLRSSDKSRRRIIDWKSLGELSENVYFIIKILESFTFMLKWKTGDSALNCKFTVAIDWFCITT